MVKSLLFRSKCYIKDAWYIPCPKINRIHQGSFQWSNLMPKDIWLLGPIESCAFLVAPRSPHLWKEHPFTTFCFISNQIYFYVAGQSVSIPNAHLALSSMDVTAMSGQLGRHPLANLAMLIGGTIEGNLWRFDITFKFKWHALHIKNSCGKQVKGIQSWSQT